MLSSQEIDEILKNLQNNRDSSTLHETKPLDAMLLYQEIPRQAQAKVDQNKVDEEVSNYEHQSFEALWKQGLFN